MESGIAFLLSKKKVVSSYKTLMLKKYSLIFNSMYYHVSGLLFNLFKFDCFLIYINNMVINRPTR